MNINDLALAVEGELTGNNDFFTKEGFTGRFTFLNEAKEGDIIIRHWINGKGIEIAASKKVACLITQNPKDDAVEFAKKLNFPLIVTDKIELANAYALSWTVDTYSPNSKEKFIK